jgi:hypothetical protein
MLWDSCYTETVVELQRNLFYWHLTVLGNLRKGRLKGDVCLYALAQYPETLKECESNALHILDLGTI